jgi:hypothetical protein
MSLRLTVFVVLVAGFPPGWVLILYWATALKRSF